MVNGAQQDVRSDRELHSDSEALDLTARPSVAWDCGLCCGFQCYVLLIVLIVLCSVIFVFSIVGSTYWFLATWLHWVLVHVYGDWNHTCSQSL